MKIKAAILEELNKPLVIDEITCPDALSFGQVLVKVHYSGICGAQINEIEGAKGSDRFLPHLLGHEGSATVLDVGAGVKTVKKDDRVVMHWRPSDGLQCDPPVYTRGGARVNAGWVTTFNDHAVVSENRLTVIPESFDLKQAPLFGCAVTTAMGVVNNDAKLKVGESVVIFGVGGVGLNLAQSCRMVSANPIIGIDISESKREMGLRMGLTHFLNPETTDEIPAAVREIVGAAGADVVIDTTGKARVIETAYDLTHADGRTILVGVPTKGDNVTIYTLPLHFKKVLTGSHGGSSDPHLEIPRYIRLCETGMMSLDGLITNEFGLDDINEAIDLVRSGQAGRVLVNMETGS